MLGVMSALTQHLTNKAKTASVMPGSKTKLKSSSGERWDRPVPLCKLQMGPGFCVKPMQHSGHDKLKAGRGKMVIAVAGINRRPLDGQHQGRNSAASASVFE